MLYVFVLENQSPMSNKETKRPKHRAKNRETARTENEIRAVDNNADSGDENGKIHQTTNGGEDDSKKEESRKSRDDQHSLYDNVSCVLTTAETHVRSQANDDLPEKEYKSNIGNDAKPSAASTKDKNALGDQTGKKLKEFSVNRHTHLIVSNFIVKSRTWVTSLTIRLLEMACQNAGHTQHNRQ